MRLSPTAPGRPVPHKFLPTYKVATGRIKLAPRCAPDLPSSTPPQYTNGSPMWRKLFLRNIANLSVTFKTKAQFSVFQPRKALSPARFAKISLDSWPQRFIVSNSLSFLRIDFLFLNFYHSLTSPLARHAPEVSRDSRIQVLRR